MCQPILGLDGWKILAGQETCLPRSVRRQRNYYCTDQRAFLGLGLACDAIQQSWKWIVTVPLDGFNIFLLCC